MARYILIDNCSGFVFGDSADLDGKVFDGSPLEYAAALDASIGEHGRSYEEVGRHALAANESGYHVYCADVTVSGMPPPKILDGSDMEMVRAIERDCHYVTTIRCFDAI